MILTVPRQVYLPIPRFIGYLWITQYFLLQILHTLFPTKESKPLRNDDYINLFGHYQA